MPIFTPEYRQEAKRTIISLFREHANISALLLVGSAAASHMDELSDLDFYVIVEAEENIPSVMDYIKNELHTQFSILCFVQIDARNMQFCNFTNYLEINISYNLPENVRANAPHWQILFDKTNSFNTIMQTTWEEFSHVTPQKNSETYQYKLIERAGETWHYIFHAAVAIKRGKYWRAIKEMDFARNNLIELKGLRNSLGTKRQTEIDRLPQAELALLQTTLPSNLSKEALFENLCHLVTAVYDEFENNGAGRHIAVSRQRVMEYIESVIQL